MKITLPHLWAGVVFAATAAVLPAQEESKSPVLDWLYVDAGPVALTQDLPVYPTKQVKRGADGVATVSFVVNEQGNVEQVSVPEATDAAFAEAAATAVAQWRFTPAKQGGQTVSTRLQAPFIFESGRKPRLLISLASYGSYTGEIVRSQDASLPEPEFQARPVYPADLRSKGVGGEVVLNFVVTENGEIANVKLVSASHPALAVAASNALLRWKFKPGVRHGRPVAVAYRVPFVFSVNDDAK